MAVPVRSPYPFVGTASRPTRPTETRLPGTRRSATRRRRGAAAVEFAIAAPVLFTIVLAIFQFGGMMMVHNLITAAAREGGRIGSLASTSSTQAVIDAVEERLSMGGIDPELTTITVSPTPLSDVPPGAEVTVTVSGQMSDLAFFWPDSLGSGPPISAEITYNRE